jgi:hypothetical protein
MTGINRNILTTLKNSKQYGRSRIIMNHQTEQKEIYDDIPDFFGKVWITMESAL